MKTKKLILALVLFASFALLQAASDNESYKIGDTGPAGGIVFYDKGNNSDGWRYLEAAPTDQRSLAWASRDSWSTDITTGTAVGTGKRNTELILAEDPNAPAAKACKNLKTGGKTDWFLPSKDELNLMYLNLKANNIGSFADEGWHWSSSQYSANTAWSQYFSDRDQDTFINKLSTGGVVRAVRAF